MYTDAELRPSQAQSVVGAVGNYVSANTIDLLAAVNNHGRGRPRRAYVVMSTALAGATDIKAQYIQSSNADLSSPDVLIDGAVVAAANAVAGAVLMDAALPDNTKRYVGFRYVTTGATGANATTGAVSAYLVADTDYNPYLPSNTGRN